MIGALNSNTFFNTIALARQNVRALILVVEGDDDHFLVKTHVNDVEVLLIAGVGGRPVVLDAAEKAERQNVRGVRFMIDVDYDRFTDPTRRYPSNVVASKHHDAIVDLLIVNTGLLDRVIEAHARTAVRKGAKIDAAQVRQAAFELAGSVAPLRIANDRNGYGLNLKKFPFGELKTLMPTPAHLAELVVRRSGHTRTQADVEADILSECAHLGLNLSLLVGDHDYFRALAKVLRLAGVVGLSDEALWSAFLSGVTCANLAFTDWYQELVDWGAANARSTFVCPCAA